MEIDRSIYTDLIFHIFAHMKVNNASDTYDEAYVANMEKELSRKTVIPESVTAYYCANFERLAFVNFLPYFMARSVDEVCYMIGQVGMATEEDAEKFIQPFCDVIRELSADYAKYWEKKAKDNQESYEGLKAYLSEQTLVTMKRFFESLRGMTNTKLKLLISESLRCNGRATIMGDTCIVTLPMPSERYSKQQIFMQLVHECTHMMTDPLIKSIRMDDGSHDIAECQVMLFDLWLFERDSEELRDAYVKWISQEVLEECEKSLSDERKNKMKEIFEKTS
ncbi:MAG: hypothetical protein IJL09_00260 [Lachnospiraceae bacterium]|jgi:hypothetical protein|nr:hypothetical protein [Lachnospiraceae bacterium]MBQ6093813.1 hypothetical protein [Lachnospiraceae bacterium]